MAKFQIKRTIFLTPTSFSAGVKGTMAALPNRVTLRKGEQFEGELKPSNQPNVNSTIVFDYGGYHFEKPYGGTDVYANMNAKDLVVFMPQGALVGTPQNSNAKPTPTTRPMEGGNSIAVGEPNPNAPITPTSKSTSGSGILQFKDKLHAGVTLVGVALGVYYAYKTKASIGKYIGYSLGAGAVGFILGSVASSFAMQTPVKQLKQEGNVAVGAKPVPKPPKIDTSVESGTMTTQMNLIL